MTDDPLTDAGKPARVAISRLKLANFRNYESLSLRLAPSHVVLTGENGAGKTNLLEAVSFLSPGRGLRRAAYADVTRSNAPDGFAIHASIEAPEGSVDVGTGLAGNAPGDTARRVRINGVTAAAADELLDYSRILWLVPAMDGLFTGPAADRRRFLDRMVLAIDPAHGKRVLDYEKAMRSRNRLLTEERSNDAWLDAIETPIGRAWHRYRCRARGIDAPHQWHDRALA